LSDFTAGCVWLLLINSQFSSASHASLVECLAGPKGCMHALAHSRSSSQPQLITFSSAASSVHFKSINSSAAAHRIINWPRRRHSLELAIKVNICAAHSLIMVPCALEIINPPRVILILKGISHYGRVRIYATHTCKFKRYVVATLARVLEDCVILKFIERNNKTLAEIFRLA
jgi:hypothetical protein